MAQENINIGAANAKGGDTLFDAFTKVQSNFDELYTRVQPENVVTVNQESDFPAPVGGVITLESDKVYQIGAPITTANRFQCGTNNLITSNNPFTTPLTYTGTGTMFTAVSTSFALDRIVINCPNAKAFSVSSAVGIPATFGLNIVTVAACQEIGDFDSLRSINITNTGFFSATDGINITGVNNWDAISILRLRIATTNPSAIGINFNSSIQRSVEIADYILDSSVAATGIAGLANSANITSGFIASVSRCEFPAGTVPLDGITEDDIRFSFFGNSGIPDSTVDANPYLTTPTTVTINAIGTYEKVNAGNWSFSEASRLSVSTDGDITNLLELPIKLQINGTCTVEKVGGGSDLITARFVYNDLPNDAQSVITEVGTDNTTPTNIALTGIFVLQPGDSISIYVANQNSTSNVIVDYGKFSLLRVL